MKQNAILLSETAEFFWAFFRFSPYLTYLRMKKYKGSNIKYIVLTEEDKFDLYGRSTNILIPLKIPNRSKYWTNCYKLMGLKKQQYLEIQKIFYDKYSERFNIIDHIYPDISKPVFCQKNQIPKSQMIYEWFPRERNFDLTKKYLPNDKPLVVLSPRYREFTPKRNWPHWKTFFNMVADDKYLMTHFNFILCGKKGEYIPDKQKRFYDLNDIQLDENSSLAGILMATMSKTYFTFGSQSAIPNISLLYGVEVLEFGNQKVLHTKVYNVKKTPVTFIEDHNFKIDPRIIFKKFKRRLQEKEKEK